jgi:hypothetical protein
MQFSFPPADFATDKQAGIMDFCQHCLRHEEEHTLSSDRKPGKTPIISAISGARLTYGRRLS